MKNKEAVLHFTTSLTIANLHCIEIIGPEFHSTNPDPSPNETALFSKAATRESKTLKSSKRSKISLRKNDINSNDLLAPALFVSSCSAISVLSNFFCPSRDPMDSLTENVVCTASGTMSKVLDQNMSPEGPAISVEKLKIVKKEKSFEAVFNDEVFRRLSPVVHPISSGEPIRQFQFVNNSHVHFTVKVFEEKCEMCKHDPPCKEGKYVFVSWKSTGGEYSIRMSEKFVEEEYLIEGRKYCSPVPLKDEKRKFFTGEMKTFIFQQLQQLGERLWPEDDKETKEFHYQELGKSESVHNFSENGMEDEFRHLARKTPLPEFPTHQQKDNSAEAQSSSSVNVSESDKDLVENVDLQNIMQLMQTVELDKLCNEFFEPTGKRIDFVAHDLREDEFSAVTIRSDLFDGEFIIRGNSIERNCSEVCWKIEPANKNYKNLQIWIPHEKRQINTSIAKHLIPTLTKRTMEFLTKAKTCHYLVKLEKIVPQLRKDFNENFFNKVTEYSENSETEKEVQKAQKMADLWLWNETKKEIGTKLNEGDAMFWNLVRPKVSCQESFFGSVTQMSLIEILAKDSGFHLDPKITLEEMTKNTPLKYEYQKEPKYGEESHVLKKPKKLPFPSGYDGKSILVSFTDNGTKQTTLAQWKIVEDEDIYCVQVNWRSPNGVLCESKLLDRRREDTRFFWLRSRRIPTKINEVVRSSVENHLDQIWLEECFPKNPLLHGNEVLDGDSMARADFGPKFGFLPEVRGFKLWPHQADINTVPYLLIWNEDNVFYRLSCPDENEFLIIQKQSSDRKFVTPCGHDTLVTEDLNREILMKVRACLPDAFKPVGESFERSPIWISYKEDSVKPIGERRVAG